MIYPINHRQAHGKDNTAYWEGFLTSDDIALILDQPEWKSMQAGKVGSNIEAFNPDIRSSDIGWIGRRQELLAVWEKISNTVAEVNRRFFHLDLTGFYEPMQIGVYNADQRGHYDWHIDCNASYDMVPRKLSVSILLSDPSEYEGGELQVKIDSDASQTLDTQKGRAWFFPSYALHRVSPVTRGIRKSLVLWAGGPAFR